MKRISEFTPASSLKGAMLVPVVDKTIANTSGQNLYATLDQLKNMILGAIPPPPTGVEWVTKPTVTVSGTTVSISAGEADFNGTPVSYLADTETVTLPASGLIRQDAIAALADGTYAYIEGGEASTAITPNIPSGSLFVAYLLFSSQGGTVVNPPASQTVTPVTLTDAATITIDGSQSINFNLNAPALVTAFTFANTLPGYDYRVDITGNVAEKVVNLTAISGVSFTDLEDNPITSITVPVGGCQISYYHRSNSLRRVEVLAGSQAGTVEGEAASESASAVLAFTNPFGHIRTTALAGNQTFTRTGNSLGSTVVQPYTADGVATVAFDFAHYLLNTAFVSGNALETGEYELYFNNRGASVAINVATIGSSGVAIPNSAPSASAGSDQSITLPTDSITLTGSGSDSDGTIASYAWSKVSGGAATITSPSSATTTVTGFVAGSYVFRLTVTDNEGATSTDDVTITVNAQAVNQAPTANAGTDQTITLPANSVTLSGSGSDTDGSITSYAWSKVSGGSATITSPAAASTDITGLAEGSYIFRLTVTDNEGATATDDIAITVSAAATTTLNAPTGLSTTPISTSEVLLSWTDTNANPNESNYIVEVSTNGGSTWVANWVTRPADSTTYNHTSMAANQTRHYRVRAKGNGTTILDSPNSVVVSGTSYTSLLSAPTNFAVAEASNGYDFQWSSVTNNQGYAIEGSADNSTWSALTTAAAGATAASVTGYSAPTLRYFRIKALGNAQHKESAWASNNGILYVPTQEAAVFSTSQNGTVTGNSFTSDSQAISGGWIKQAVASKSMPSGANNGYVQAVTGSTAQYVGIGLDNSATLGPYGNIEFMLFTSTNGKYYYFGDTAGSTEATALTWQAGDVLRIERVGSRVYYKVARSASPTFFMEVGSKAVVTGALWPKVVIDSPDATVSNVRLNGVS